MNKNVIFKIIAVVAVIFLLGFSIHTWVKLKQTEENLQTTTNLLSGEKDILQKRNDQLGLAESTIVEKDALISDYEKTTKSLKKEIDALKSKVNTKPTSKDTVVVVVEKVIEGGSQTSTEKDGVVAYEWTSKDKRFNLQDPDIKISDNEKFKYDLKVKVTGYVLSDDSGNFQARQVVAQEVLPDGTLGEPLPIENNIYQYSVKKQEKSFFDILHPRVYALLDTDLDPGLGVEVVNLGHWIPYANVGIGPFAALNIDDMPASIPNSKIGIGAQYQFVPPLLNTNLGLGIGVSTPTNDLFGTYQVTGNLIFYLTN